MLKDKIYLVGQCKIGNQALSLYNEKVYGIKCQDKDKWLELMLWAYDKYKCTNIVDCKNCSNNTDCNFCNLQANIGKLTKHCIDCKPVNYKQPIITPSEDYSCWYNSQEYLDCLTIQLENEGYIEPMISLCENLNPAISITVPEICDMIMIELTAQCVDCFEVDSNLLSTTYNNVINNIINNIS